MGGEAMTVSEALAKQMLIEARMSGDHHQKRAFGAMG
jgi:hypothetical protein